MARLSFALLLLHLLVLGVSPLRAPATWEKVGKPQKLPANHVGILPVNLPVNAAPKKGAIDVPKWGAGSSADKCYWTSPDGWTYDLRALSRGDSQEDWKVAFPKSKFHIYANICANTRKVPKQCEQYEKTHPSVAYQIHEGMKDCYWLGDVSTPIWDYVDKEKPRKGTVLSYYDGETCAGGKKRSVHFHMICAANFEAVDEPSFVYESPTCEYHVVWPNVHACPSRTRDTVLRWLGRLLFLVMVVAAYFGAGYIYNSSQNGLAGWEAVPHGDAVFAVAQACKCACATDRRSGGARGGGSGGGGGGFDRMPMQ